MIIVILFIVFSMVIFDVHLLRQHDVGLFDKTFDMRRSYVIGLLAPLFLILLLSGDLLKMFAVYFLLVVLPYYLIKRRRYWIAGSIHDEKFTLLYDANGVVLSWMFGGVVIATVISAYFDFILQFDSELAEILLSGMGSSLLLMALIYRAACRLSPQGFMANVGLVKGRGGWMWLIVWPVLVGLIFAGISAYFVVYRETMVQTPLSEVIAETQSTDIFLIFLFLAVCIAPAVEEIVFRGYFFRVIHQAKGMLWALLIVSLSFAALHVGQYWGDWLAIAMIAVIGLVLCVLRAASGSTISSMVMHYTYNIFVTTLPVVMIMVNNPAYFEYQSRYMELGTQEKEALLLRTIEVNPKLAEAHYELATLYAEFPSKMSLALHAIDNALSIYPQDKAFLELKAQILEKLGNFNEALTIRNGLLKRQAAKRLRPL